MTILLASTSPRRYHILSLLRLPFLMIPPASAEITSDARLPEREVLYQAEKKAASLAAAFPGTVVIGSDTLINLDGQKIGKPRDASDARVILKRLRDREHQVVTGVVILRTGDSRRYEGVEIVRVRMAASSDAQLEAYVSSGDPFDKAGGYSLQGGGRELVAGLTGDYLAAVGLPLKAVAEGLEHLHVPVPVDVAALYRDREFLNWKTFKEC